MPIYTYECDCKYTEELLVPANSPKKIKCPKCGKLTFHRYIGHGLGRLYKPDREKILSTMEYKETTYSGPNKVSNVSSYKPYPNGVRE